MVAPVGSTTVPRTELEMFWPKRLAPNENNTALNSVRVTRDMACIPLPENPLGSGYSARYASRCNGRILSQAPRECNRFHQLIFDMNYFPQNATLLDEVCNDSRQMKFSICRIQRMGGFPKLRRATIPTPSRTTTS